MARLANQFSMLEFFRVPEVRRMPGINNAMTRILTQGIEGRRSEPILDDTGEDLSLDLALGELASLDTFGIMERYEESTGIIFPILGFPIPETVPQKQKLELIANEEAGLRPIEKENVTEEIREAIQTLVSKDVLIYQKGTQIFNERIKQK